ncbi:MAG: hypothetical protein F4003_00465, partial [Acidimicrobiaceae bacterium]|nr:hypothetical protein [Acidimicrobiaceae bacterium]
MNTSLGAAAAGGALCVGGSGAGVGVGAGGWAGAVGTSSCWAGAGVPPDGVLSAATKSAARSDWPPSLRCGVGGAAGGMGGGGAAGGGAGLG